MSSSTTDTGAKPKEFQAEVAKLLHLMVHSVYSEREVFLRELISNASDACDRLRYEALKNDKLMQDGGDLRITISLDKKAKTLTIADTGIGMDAKELADNLGTIARSGTQAFMEQMETASKKGDKDVNLIGQFGVGFYSSFMIAEHVDVVSRKAGAKKVNLWSSDGTGTYTVSEYKGDDAPERGTSIRLKLRKDAKEFLEDQRLQYIVRTYSDHVSHPIYLGDEQVNSGSAIWARSKSDVTEEQHREFFGHVAGVIGDPAMTIHYRAEGRNEYSVLLYVPGEKPFDLFDPERKGKQKLYVRRVFITDEAEMLPSYLRFVRGVIDSEDMPLNISREMLQDNPTVHTIRKAVCAGNHPTVTADCYCAAASVCRRRHAHPGWLSLSADPPVVGRCRAKPASRVVRWIGSLLPPSHPRVSQGGGWRARCPAFRSLVPPVVGSPAHWNAPWRFLS